jgi:hypothetical protein
MANYSDIKGTTVLTVTSDPTDAIDGQIWYNSTDLELKSQGATYGAFAFSEIADLPNWKSTGAGGGKTTAAWITGGSDSQPLFQETYLYNGASWTTSGNLARGSQASGSGSAGLSTAGLIWGGGNPRTNASEKFDGSSWSTSPNFPSAGNYSNGCGLQNAALSISRDDGTPWGQCFEFDGSSWATGGTLPFASYSQGGSGIQTAGVSAGGEGNPDPAAKTQHSNYNGTSWTAKTTMTIGRAFYGNGVAGPQGDTLVMGGQSGPPAAPTATEYWNGSAWATQGTLPLEKYSTATGNNNPSVSSALLMGGGASTPVDQRAKVLQGIPAADTPAARTVNTPDLDTVG